MRPGIWDFTPCSEKRHFVCEISKGIILTFNNYVTFGTIYFFIRYWIYVDVSLSLLFAKIILINFLLFFLNFTYELLILNDVIMNFKFKKGFLNTQAAFISVVISHTIQPRRKGSCWIMLRIWHTILRAQMGKKTSWPTQKVSRSNFQIGFLFYLELLELSVITLASIDSRFYCERIISISWTNLSE